MRLGTKPLRVFLVLTAFGIATSGSAETTWKCTEVIDGDTIVAESDTGQTVEVDLFGVDAPEISQPFGEEAKKFLEDLVLGQQISISNASKAENRVTAVVHVDGADVSEAMVREGLAWLPKDDNTAETIAIAIFSARAEGAGLWSDENAEHPSLWRDRHRPPPPGPTPEPRLSDIAGSIDLGHKSGEPVVIADIPPRFMTNHETKVLVENMAVIAEAAEGLEYMEAAYDRHCSHGGGSSSSTGGSVWSEELNQWVDGSSGSREEACREVSHDISATRGAIKKARDRVTDDARRFGVQDQIIREVVNYFDLGGF